MAGHINYTTPVIENVRLYGSGQEVACLLARPSLTTNKYLIDTR